MYSFRLPVFLICLLASIPHLAAENFYATQLTSLNIHRLPAGGFDAIGGLGDWFLTDGELCAVVSGAQHNTYLALHGGALVDLWHCDLANDQWNVAHTQFNMQKDEIPPTQAITAGFTPAESWVQTRGSREGLEATVRYRLEVGKPGELEIETTITRNGEGARMGMFGALVLHPRASLTPFTLDTTLGEYSSGFDQVPIDTADRGSVLSAVSAADLQVLLGSRHIMPSISYGLRVTEALHRDRDGGERPLHSFLISGQTFTLFGAFTRPFPSFWPRTPGLVSFALGQVFDLAPGQSFLFRQSVAVSSSGDAAAITDRINHGAVIRGRLDTADAGITVTAPGGAAVTYARPDQQGNFSFRLPAGLREIDMAVRTPWSETTHRIEAAAPATDLGEIASGAPGTLLLPRGEAMALMFRTAGGRPVFNDELAGASVAGERQLSGPESYRLSLSGSVSDPTEVRLPPGEYRVLASRGPEYSVTEATLRLAAGESTGLEIAAPTRALATPGLLSADFHVHSGVSFDSSLPPRQRVIDFAAQGGEVLVPTEHNISFDLRPTIAELGLTHALFSFPGVEITGMARSAATPTTIGHSNVFPVEANADAFMGGTLPFEGKRLGEVIGTYKKHFPDSIFQLNHPRSKAFDDDISFFNHLSRGVAFDPSRPLDAAPNDLLLEALPGSAYRDIDFDAMELLNGESMDIYELVRTDWFALLQQDFYKVATANSDSHVSHQLVAYPRSFIEVENDDPATVSGEEIAAAVRRGALYGSTGPIIRVSLDGTGPGGVHQGGEGTLVVEITSADWVTVDELRIWVNGDLWRALPASSGETITTDLSVERDSFVFVEVLGAPSETYRAVAPGFQPFAFANPVFIDVAGDGWQYATP